MLELIGCILVAVLGMAGCIVGLALAMSAGAAEDLRRLDRARGRFVHRIGYGLVQLGRAIMGQRIVARLDARPELLKLKVVVRWPAAYPVRLWLACRLADLMGMLLSIDAEISEREDDHYRCTRCGKGDVEARRDGCADGPCPMGPICR